MLGVESSKLFLLFWNFHQPFCFPDFPLFPHRNLETPWIFKDLEGKNPRPGIFPNSFSFPGSFFLFLELFSLFYGSFPAIYKNYFPNFQSKFFFSRSVSPRNWNLWRVRKKGKGCYDSDCTRETPKIKICELSTKGVQKWEVHVMLMVTMIMRHSVRTGFCVIVRIFQKIISRSPQRPTVFPPPFGTPAAVAACPLALLHCCGGVADPGKVCPYIYIGWGIELY